MNKNSILLILAMLISLGLACGNSSTSSSNSGSTSIPATPTNINVVTGDRQITISWNSVSNATSYNIYWSLNTGVSKSSNKISGLSSPYTHTPLTNGTTYYYVVTAINSEGESNLSVEVSAKPTAVAIAAGKWDEMKWDVGVWGN